jgi:aspartate/methionine/tyrosine aminotransferase
MLSIYTKIPLRSVRCFSSSRQDGMKECNSTLGSLPTTIFTKMTSLALEYNSINLAQGFPDPELEGPQSMLDQASALFKGTQANQYAPMLGTNMLRQSIAEHCKQFTGISVDKDSQVLVTVGATEGLASAFLGMLNVGDEVILQAPHYDSYVPMIERAGAVARIITLDPPNWTFDAKELESLFNEKTKLIVINTPHNPTGKVFTVAELQTISNLCVKYNTYAVLDEVYQFAVYPGTEHVTLQTLPGMHDRCIRIGSAGKTFSFTDFKVGWITGPSHLVSACAKAHQFITFSINSKLQNAVSYGLDNEAPFYTSLGSTFFTKRQKLTKRLAQIGFEVLEASGTYFLVADFSPLITAGRIKQMDDFEFCHEVTKEAGVTLLPISAFYSSSVPPEKIPKTLVRFVICKTDEKLDMSCDRLESYLGKSC